MIKITLTSGERVEATHVSGDIYRLPGGRMVHTWEEGGEILQDPEAEDVDAATFEETA